MNTSSCGRTEGVGRGASCFTWRVGKAPTADVKVTSQTDVFFSPSLVVAVTLAVSSTLTVPILGMFSRVARNSHAEALASISVEM